VLKRLARHDLRSWLWPGILAALLVALHVAGPGVTDALRYERTAVLAGEAWRLVTGHLVHFDRAHLGWNLLGVVLVWFLFAREYTPRGWLVILLASTAAIDFGFLVFERELDWYVGFSGVLHGCMAAGLVAWLRDERDALTALVGLLFAAKLAWEHVHGALPFTAGSLSLPVVHEAHTYGAIGGALAALWLCRLRPGRHGVPL
jgi:rhomboid family GlyGly-CTERM serine protease